MSPGETIPPLKQSSVQMGKAAHTDCAVIIHFILRRCALTLQYHCSPASAHPVLGTWLVVA